LVAALSGIRPSAENHHRPIRHTVPEGPQNKNDRWMPKPSPRRRAKTDKASLDRPLFGNVSAAATV
jgi:hypothetical protein